MLLNFAFACNWNWSTETVYERVNLRNSTDCLLMILCISRTFAQLWDAGGWLDSRRRKFSILQTFHFFPPPLSCLFVHVVSSTLAAHDLSHCLASLNERWLPPTTLSIALLVIFIIIWRWLVWTSKSLIKLLCRWTWDYRKKETLKIKD